jgi:hypothetical protein
MNTLLRIALIALGVAILMLFVSAFLGRVIPPKAEPEQCVVLERGGMTVTVCTRNPPERWSTP